MASTRSWLSIALIGAVAALNALVWVAANRPTHPPDFFGKIQGAAYSPYPFDGGPGVRAPSDAELIADLELLGRHVGAIRTYSVLEGIDRIPRLARGTSLAITLGSWIDRRRERNRSEIETLVATANANDNVTRVLVGNEAVLRSDLSADELIPYIREVRRRVRQPVSIAEPSGVWLAHPELAREVDYIAIHILPYWEEGASDANGLAHAIGSYLKVKRAYPDKPIVITEIGWPSGGRQRYATTPSVANQAAFLRGFFAFAASERIEYFVMEAIDQTWKASIEGSVGPYWGLFDAHRTAKFPLVGPVEEHPEWKLLMAASLLLALGPMLWFMRAARHIRPPAQFLFLATLQTLAGGAVWIWHLTGHQYLIGLAWLPWAALLTSLLALGVFAAGAAFDAAEVLGARALKRRFLPAKDAPRLWPVVSIHLPIHNEPPALVAATLDALARLDYPDFEVIVVDNNTAEEARWRPVERHCAELDRRHPGRFRFFHVAPLAGFKAGALNFALERTDPRASLIGVIDGDYVVEPDWLKAVVPHLDDPGIGFVQCPQDHRDFAGGAFKRMIGWEYAGFFEIGMVQRNERDAIIQHGTMVVLRRDALQGSGGWATWCIVEDAEMGLRLQRDGWRSAYVKTSLGKGVMPDDFAGYKIQRFRWAFGAVQILRRYWRDLFLPGKLSWGQRYHYVFGWAPWLADAANLLFAWTAVIWTALVVLLPEYFVLPDTPFLIPVFAIFAAKLAETLILYRARVNCGLGERVAAAIAGLGLTPTVGRAVLAGLFFRRRPFLRTPKLEGRPRLARALAMVREELALLSALWIAAGSSWVLFAGHDPDSRAWSVVLVTQSLPCLAALATSIVAACGQSDAAQAAAPVKIVASELPSGAD